MALFSSVALAAPAKQSASAAPTIRIQLNGISGEDATQHEVPADNSTFSLNAVSDIFSAQVIDAEGLKFPTCQVFSDLEGTVSSSEVSFTTDVTELLLGSVGTVQVGSVRCSHQ
ncbi:hypothetical protein G7Y89_g9607 [Cudoniella acicularis]|uniref:Uncharacterized protein n=1 Tax=Cudoniella acicularis TaxID=354080 RepID=A0A8H4W2F1_9HELO|nr:hypothetical protein G7Y89_g9607 [Cudoniella acicularis]